MKVCRDQIDISDELEKSVATLWSEETDDPQEIIRVLNLPNKLEYTEER